MDKEIIYKDLSYKINGLLFQVHGKLGRYRNEKQCGDFFEQLLKQNNIKYEREFQFFDPQYGAKNVRCIIDFIIESKIIIEFKAKSFLTKEDYFQLQRYLTTLNFQLGILVNFRQPHLVPKRIINKYYIPKVNL